MNELVLLGAGASVDAGVPDAYRMTEAIAEKLGKAWGPPPYGRLASFVIGGLLFQAGIRGEDPLHCGVNVEDFFNAVQILADRTNLEAAPFIGSWHSMVNEFDRVGPSYLNLDRLSNEIFRSVRDRLLDAFGASAPTFGERKIDSAVEQAITSAVEALARKQRPSLHGGASLGHAVGAYLEDVFSGWQSRLRTDRARASNQLKQEFVKAVDQSQMQPGHGRVFQQVAELMTRSLVDIAWIEDPERVAYLRPLVRQARAGKRLVVATLNYDNAIELAARSEGIESHTGIDEWSREGRFDFSDSGLHLLKLHGSIDWEWQRDIATEQQPMPHSVIEQVHAEQFRTQGFMPAVIFGQRNKLTAEGPFLDLLRAFQRELGNAQLLTVIGYSFRDDHINTYLSQWLNRTEANRMRVINPGFEKSQADYAVSLKSCQAQRPGQIEVIAQIAREGLSTLYETAQEQRIDSAAH